MKRILISDIMATPQKFHSVTVCGWVRTVRDSKVVGFIELNDGSCLSSAQIVVEQEKFANFDQIVKLNVGCAIVVSGKVVLTPDMKQPFEIKAEEVTVEGESAVDYPLQKKRHSVEFLREIAHLRPRTNLFNAIMRVRSVCSFAIHKFFNERGFIYVHTPIITGSDGEGAGEMFRVTTLNMEKPPLREDKTIDYKQDFFGKTVGLTVTGQLNVEAYAMAFSNVYTFGPTFRAERSNTTRHAAEFWMIEPEIAFADLNDDMQLAEDTIKYIVRYVLENCQPEMQFFNQFVDTDVLNRLNKLLDSTFKHITYTEAIKILEKNNSKFAYPVKWGSDIQTEHERYLAEEIFQGPVFVTDYPKEIKAFYMRLNDDGKTVAAMDMLVPGVGEMIGGSQREERLDVLINRMNELGLNVQEYDWYLDLRRYGGTKHAGFGIGFDRLLRYITGVGNIRDTIPFPRTVSNAEF